MKKMLIGALMLASSSAWAVSAPSSLPTSDEISEALAQFGAIQGAIEGLIATADGSSSLENDRLARSILLKMSEDSNHITDWIESLDSLIAQNKYADATKKQKEICTALTKLKADNKNARTGADLPDVGNLSSSDSQFDDIDSDTTDTQKLLKCK